MIFIRTRSLTVLCLLVLFAVSGKAQQVRSVIGLNDGWKFHLGGLEYADNPDLNDAAWRLVSLPHTWNAKDPFDDDETYVRGIGWYRKEIIIDPLLRNKKLFLFFEGANQVTDVYVNGAFAGQHKGGYTAFSIDITSQVNWKEGGKNYIAIQVNNAHDNFIAPLSVGYALYGGIYRNVWLIATDPVHFKEINNDAGGVQMRTPSVDATRANVQAATTIVNQSGAQRNLVFSNTVYDASGNKTVSFSKPFSLNAGEEITVKTDLTEITSPHLWSPEDPYLYTIRSSIVENDKIVDEVTNSIGFRWFRFSADSGFFLNGKNYVLKGTNRHQDMKGKGSALSSEDHLRDMQLIKNMGANFLRLAHYPQAPEVLHLADKLGLMIWEEVPLVNYMTIDPEFLKNSENMIREMIHQHYNHPSVVMWGSMNEILLHSKQGDRIQKHNDTTYLTAVRKYALQLDSMIRAEDPLRYTTMAMHGSGDYTKYGLDTISQVAGQNIYSGWYSGKVEDLGKYLDRHHRENPQQVIFISEYGAEGEVQLNTEKPERMDYTGQYQRFFNEAYLRQINQRRYLAGTAIWNEFDFSQPNIGGPTPHRNQKGMVTWDRQPKDVYYLYKAAWNPEPMVYIATRNWMIRAGEPNATSTMDVYSNLDDITLYINDKSQGKQKPDDVKKATWQVHLKNGKNRIAATGNLNGKTYRDEVVVEYREYNPDLTAQKMIQPISINVGSNAQYLDPSGTVWIEDRPYSKGSFGYVSGSSQNFVRTKVIKGTADVPLYYTSRDSLQAYRFDVKDGQYAITLYFVENKNIEAGERVFDVNVNDEKVISHLDLAAQYGYAQAVKKTFVVNISNGKGINVSFKPLKGNAILSGIKVEQ